MIFSYFVAKLYKDASIQVRSSLTNGGIICYSEKEFKNPNLNDLMVLEQSEQQCSKIIIKTLSNIPFNFLKLIIQSTEFTTNLSSHPDDIYQRFMFAKNVANSRGHCESVLVRFENGKSTVILVSGDGGVVFKRKLWKVGKRA
jgi:hypothetical protein